MAYGKSAANLSTKPVDKPVGSHQGNSVKAMLHKDSRPLPSFAAPRLWQIKYLFYLKITPSRKAGPASRGEFPVARKKLFGVVFGRWTIRSAADVKIVIFQ
jgi:hypothetical protein